MSNKPYIEVVSVDKSQSDNTDPIVYTEVKKSQNGISILAKTVSYKRGMPKTKYGLIQEEVPYEQSDLAKGRSHDPADYTKSFQPMPKRQVFRVKRPSLEDKKTLATILRTEFGINSPIDFLS